MSIAFPRSMRALQREQSYRSIWGLILVILFLGIWSGWFWLAEISLFETAATATLVNESQVDAFFTPDVVGQIRPGQPAFLRLDAYPWAQYGTLQATVVSVARKVENNQVQVGFALGVNSRSAIPRQAGLTGTVEVEIGQISPAMLVLRAVGQRITAQQAEVAAP